jgi:hypothetical protein
LEKLGRFLEKKKLGWSILEKQSWAGLFIGREIKKKSWAGLSVGREVFCLLF